MVPTIYFKSVMPALSRTSSATRSTICLLIFEFFDAADQRDHHFRDHLHALLRHLHGRFEDGASLHLGDLGIGDAEAAAAMTQHRVELVQLFHSME